MDAEYVGRGFDTSDLKHGTAGAHFEQHGQIAPDGEVAALSLPTTTGYPLESDFARRRKAIEAIRIRLESYCQSRRCAACVQAEFARGVAGVPERAEERLARTLSRREMSDCLAAARELRCWRWGTTPVSAVYGSFVADGRLVWWDVFEPRGLHPL